MTKPAIAKQGATPPVKKDAPTFSLPQVSTLTGSFLDQITDGLGVERSIVASDEEIKEVWSRLPRLLHRISPELRDEGIVKACIAVASVLYRKCLTSKRGCAIVGR